jgi:hypothetical protein
MISAAAGYSSMRMSLERQKNHSIWLGLSSASAAIWVS